MVCVDVRMLQVQITKNKHCNFAAMRTKNIFLFSAATFVDIMLRLLFQFIVSLSTRLQGLVRHAILTLSHSIGPRSSPLPLPSPSPTANPQPHSSPFLKNLCSTGMTKDTQQMRIIDRS